ncbi:hypothetical protein R5W24_003524 [Gemmata sp. JC717]|uniref:hypothetical protein n=1 Tax=Gemmata algarum TaxID=2975278 RepID=UPI0021BAA7E8|nr:hypothetical protein [Gemmata algarum]MDY3554402.1 hypothetical protein [Gemmata algarum]
MRLEYLPDGSPDCPLIRLFDFVPAEAAALGSAVAALAAGQLERVAVHELPGVAPVGGCELVLRRRGRDRAVVRVGPAAFECGLTADTWDNVAGLIEPFAADAGGHQWLAEAPGQVSLLLSASGLW